MTGGYPKIDHRSLTILLNQARSLAKLYLNLSRPTAEKSSVAMRPRMP